MRANAAGAMHAPPPPRWLQYPRNSECVGASCADAIADPRAVQRSLILPQNEFQSASGNQFGVRSSGPHMHPNRVRMCALCACNGLHVWLFVCLVVAWREVCVCVVFICCVHVCL